VRIDRRPEHPSGSKILLGVATFATVRFLILAIVGVETVDPGWFVDPARTLATHLPLPLLLPNRTLPGPHPVRGAAVAAEPGPGGRRLTLGVAAAVAGLFAGFGLVFVDPGVRGGGRVLLDESHSRWERTDLPFDGSRYGRASLYNFRCWREWLERHYRVETGDRFPDAGALTDFDVLIVKTPTEPYSPEEVEAVRRFVDGGGGLLLIGDHTNLFGMGTVLNGLAGPFGIRFRYDDTFPLRPGGRDLYRPGRLLNHPVVSQLREYPLETTCSLEAPLSAAPIMVGSGLGRDLVDYSHRNFFGNLRLDLDEDFGAFLQMAAVHHGLGRVLAFTDSTNFSNFSFFWPGRRELALAQVEFLNRRNGPGSRARPVAAGLALVAAATAARRLGRRPGATRLTGVLVCLWAGGILGAAAAGRCNAAAYPLPTPSAPPRYARFDRTWSGGGLAAHSAVLPQPASGNPDEFNSFFVNTARFGWIPVHEETDPGKLDGADLLVLLNPRRPFREQDLLHLVDFVRRGGRILILDSIRNPRSTAGDLLERFGLQLVLDLAAPAEAVSGRPAAPRRPGLGPPRLSLASRNPGSLVGSMGPAVFGFARQGRGGILALLDSAAFSDTGMGIVYGLPRGPERPAHAIQGEILRALAEDPPVPPAEGIPPFPPGLGEGGEDVD
ncbi:MAG: hypothetical protein HY509_05970, partial [Acidobacteria bacterium]|nr:hypothetical protein [Acidobacteriota bacterium]